MTETLAELFKNHSLAFSLCEHRVIILLLSVAPFSFNHVKGPDSLNPGVNKSQMTQVLKILYI